MDVSATYPDYYVNVDGEGDHDLANWNAADEAFKNYVLKTILTKLQEASRCADVNGPSSKTKIVDFFALPFFAPIARHIFSNDPLQRTSNV